MQAGVFLIALRMKRETDDENLGMLEAIRDATRRATAPVDEVLDIGDPYDGYNRTLPAAPFLPAVLAACGVATVSHGVESMGPKYGVTHRQVLRAAGLPVDLAPEAGRRAPGRRRASAGPTSTRRRSARSSTRSPPCARSSSSGPPSPPPRCWPGPCAAG